MSTLYLVGTPIGNLEDMSARGIRILTEVDFIAAEDTRVARRLLNHFGISNELTSYHDFSKPGVLDRLLNRMRGGETCALISDAGMPGISDPGFRVVEKAAQAGVTVIPVPGASAQMLALVGSGLPTDRFLFAGFVNRKKGREKQLDWICNQPVTTVFYESPHRLRKTLNMLNTRTPGRRLVIGRELTKMHEEFARGTCAELSAYYEDNEPRGEYVLVLEGTEMQERRNSREEQE